MSEQMGWRIGLARRVITPRTPVWLAGYGSKRVPEGTLHDLWVKVVALQDPAGKRVVMATTDHMGMSRTVYDGLISKIGSRCGLAPADFMITFSHNHCGPVLKNDLVDYYPLDDEQRAVVDEYTDWMEDQVVEAVVEALDNMQPGRIFKGSGTCTFAVNRRENTEGEIAAGKAPVGAVDHDVPVLALRNPEGELLGVLFGYACHPTTLAFNHWCGDYPGWAQLAIEASFPGTMAAFFNACGADANPIPRRSVELAEGYGKMLAEAVEQVLAGEMEPVRAGRLQTALTWVDLPYEELVTRETLEPVAAGPSALHARWARRMLRMIAEGIELPAAYQYPVQVWRIGSSLLFIAIGGEAVVDYSLRFKREFGPSTWVCGYANDMAAYIPSRRVWEEGGYEGGSHLDEYGRPAWRWAGDVEDRISGAVHGLIHELQ